MRLLKQLHQLVATELSEKTQKTATLETTLLRLKVCHSFRCLVYLRLLKLLSNRLRDCKHCTRAINFNNLQRRLLLGLN